MGNGEKKPQGGRKTVRNTWLWFAVVCAVLAVMVGVVTAKFPPVLKGEMQGAQAQVPAPGFTLQDQQGRPTSLAQFRGKVVALTFIDPECTQLCPLTTHSMVQALRILGPSLASHVQLIGIDANPLKTKIADVADYTQTHDLQGRWRFLTGSRAQLEKIWHEYHVYVAVVNNDIEHTAIVVLIDRNGNERNFYSTPMSYADGGSQAETIAEGIASLLPGHPALAPALADANEAEQQPEEPANPIRTLSLTPLGPKRPAVALGSEHAHLVVFFAGWLEGYSDLPKDLAALDSYSAVAQRKGWPSPVAVDELTTEPSPAEANSVLAPLANRLKTPIVEDTSGRIADNYHVDDLPWFVLSSASGKILWKHDGWLSAASLKRQVGAALARS